MNLTVGIDAVGMAAPGVDDWIGGQAWIAASMPASEAVWQPPKTELLPANELRRMTRITRLAFQVCEQTRDAASSPRRAVFASASGDLDTLDKLCRTLCKNPRAISPTAFHNSVGNAPAGYWSIATGDRGPSTSISAAADTFITGLLESAVQARYHEEAVLYACFDIASPELLRASRPVDAPFGVALVCTPGDGALGNLELSFQTRSDRQVRPAGPEPDALAANPSARALPLLAMIAGARADEVACEAEHGVTVLSWTPRGD